MCVHGLYFVFIAGYLSSGPIRGIAEIDGVSLSLFPEKKRGNCHHVDQVNARSVRFWLRFGDELWIDCQAQGSVRR
jgi:hypothetical protein